MSALLMRGPYIIPRLSRMYWHLSGLYQFGRQNWRSNFPGALMTYNRPRRRRRKNDPVVVLGSGH
jgi:hypothetical protein